MPELPAQDSRDGSAAPPIADPREVRADGTIAIEEGVNGSATDFSTFKPKFAYGVTPSTVTLTWAPITGAEQYAVSRNGIVLVRLNSGEDSFHDTDLAPATEYEYQLSASGVSDDGLPTQLSARTVEIQTAGNQLKRSSNGSVVPFTNQPYDTAFVWKTFIPQSRVDLDFFATISCGAIGDGGVQFGGDNRGYQTPNSSTPNETPDYRTQMFVNVNWDNPSPYDFYLGKYVNASTKYDDGVLVDTETASADGMTFTNVQHSGNFASVRLNHDVGNPFCSAGSIKYNANINFYRSGTVEVVGSRAPVPDHEGYARFNNTGSEFWVTMFNRDNKGFDCLSGGCTPDDIITSQSR
ncbi:hypothetical protein [Gryllotalpicola protaetiae]|uniref:hypothetical protein n=1 Tax=Gryllotalpicola protaetiae TaxID=2419771 RepID=UPI0013C47B28|nr:hypothetical protein [Gryllotalpicola protaetiae]